MNVEESAKHQAMRERAEAAEAEVKQLKADLEALVAAGQAESERLKARAEDSETALRTGLSRSAHALAIENVVAAKEIERLKAELAKHQESEFHPDWSLLEATRSSLREHMAMLKAIRATTLEEARKRLVDIQSDYGSIADTRGVNVMDAAIVAVRAIGAMPAGLVAVPREGSQGLDALLFELGRAAGLMDAATDDHHHDDDPEGAAPCVPCEVCDRVHFVLVSLRALVEVKP